VAAEVEDLNFIDLALVQSLPHGLSVQRPSWASPEAGCRPVRAGGPSRSESREHVQQVAAVAEGVDQCGVARAGGLRKRGRL